MSMSITTISSTGGIITTNLITCQSCAFENEPTCTRCAMCRTVLARGQSPPARSSTWSSGPKWKSRRSEQRFKWRDRANQSRGCVAQTAGPLQTFAKKCKVCARRVVVTYRYGYTVIGSPTNKIYVFLTLPHIPPCADIHQ